MIVKTNKIIRRAKYEDKELIRYMVKKMDDYHYNTCLSFRQAVNQNYNKHHQQSATLVDRINIEDFYILEVFNKPIGTIMVWDNNGETTLINFFIEEKYRNQGYGTYLLDKIIKDMQTSYCVLSVFKENKKSLEFYYRYGFYYIQTEETNQGKLLWLRYNKENLCIL